MYHRHGEQMRTKPEVFVIESLGFNDELKNRFEGKMIAHILNHHKKKSKYFYIRTKKELEAVLKKFSKSRYRYLHLSCHGNSSEMATTLDSIKFDVLGKMLRPFLNERRVFVSACDMVNDELAHALIPNSGCYSVIGPCTRIEFGDAAIFWTTLYHLMFRFEAQSMKQKELRENIGKISKLLQVDISYFSYSRNSKSGFKKKPFGNCSG